LSTVAQTIAAGSGLAVERGDVTFRFTNSWNYNVGTYTQTITFTLTSP
jgi:arginine decarboxylase-like protein